MGQTGKEETQMAGNRRRGCGCGRDAGRERGPERTEPRACVVFEEDMPMCRHPNPALACPGEEKPCRCGMEDAVREQTERLAELSCAVNALTGVLLAYQRGET